MPNVQLAAEVREGRGKGPARRLRQDGRIPAVLYGHGFDAVALSVDETELRDLLQTISTENTLIDLRLEGAEAGPATATALIREVQRHPWQPRILHVDFFKISMEERITVEIPVALVGVPVGVKAAGGILEMILRDIEIECLPGDIPEKIELDVTALGIGDSIRVRDITIPKVQIKADPDQAIVTVVPPTVMVEPEKPAAPEAEIAEPEVIARERKEEEPEEGAGEKRAAEKPGERKGAERPVEKKGGEKK